MAHEQITYMTSERRTAWGIPQDKFTEHGTSYGAAQAALQKVLDKAERTHVMTVECQQAFDALKKVMRYFRDRFFKIPPLWASNRRTRTPRPRRRPQVCPRCPSVTPAGRTCLTRVLAPPVDGEGLQHYRFTRRKKERTTFDGAESGMTVYVCSRYENRKGEVGNWGPVVSAVIP
jgi:hypothetical protein